MRDFAVIRNLHRVDAILGGAGELAIASDGLDFIFLHQEIEAFGVLGDDFVFALLDGSPVELAGVDTLDAEFFRFFEMIPELSVEKQSLRGDAAYVEASTAKKSVFFDQGSFEAVLAGADSRSITSGSAADDGYVVDRVGQRVLLSRKR